MKSGKGQKRIRDYENGNSSVFNDERTPLTRMQDDKARIRRRESRCRRLASTFAVMPAFVAFILSVMAFGVTLFGGSSSTNLSNLRDCENDTCRSVPPDFVQEGGKQLFDELGRYIIEDYDVHPVFSNFLPAVAGYFGKPLYAFYVNRGQGIASFGTESKDYPIMEFHSANVAYQTVAFRGFRTFFQFSRRSKDSFEIVEPFDIGRAKGSHAAHIKTTELPKRFMYTGTNNMQIQEIDRLNGIETNVTFFILPEEDFGAFVKRTTVRNMDARKGLQISVLDGLAQIEPAGGKMNQLLKNMGRTLEAWKGVYHPYKDSLTMPFYRLSTTAGDSASVIVETAGHWCLSIFENESDPELLPIIYDPSSVFGEDVSLSYPSNLFDKTIKDLIHGPQYGAAKTASAFAALDDINLAPGESFTITTFFGKTDQIFNVPVIARRLLQPGFGQYKMSRANEIIQQITAAVDTKTDIPLFDLHVQQMFLDNSLRGGIPSILGEVDDDTKMRNADEDDRLKVFHFFSRSHGDLERDDNDFIIAPHFLSEGPVNFRDVIQNRRNDVTFNPSIGSHNIKTFLSFIQADGYEPLSVEAPILAIEDERTCRRLATLAVGEADGHRAQREAVESILCSGPFRPGQLFELMEEQNVYLMISKKELIDRVAASSKQFPMAVVKSGYWADHWTYYMDLIDNYLSVFPDWEERVMYENDLPYFFSPLYVKPREEKYVLSMSFDGRSEHVRQLDCVEEDEDKVDYMKQYIKKSTGWYDYKANWQHSEDGNTFKSTPIAKLFLLATLKFATRDAMGMGIEYEAGKPGWNDANNGLVGMLGSGMPESFELVVLLKYIKSIATRYGRPLLVPYEIHEMVEEINESLAELRSERDTNLTDSGYDGMLVPEPRFRYWEKVSAARERYRSKTKVTFKGTVVELSANDVVNTIDSWMLELDEGIARSFLFGTSTRNTTNVPPTYYFFTVTEWNISGLRNSEGHPLVTAKELRIHVLPLFLEGPTRYLKTVPKDIARNVYTAVRQSPLHDEQLNMYTISASLAEENIDLGREVAFAPGWLENQSVWMHVSYKFYLQLLRHDMFIEFFKEMLYGGMLPFIEPQRYGRSIIEPCSFIVSSAFEDPGVQGRGFLSRLSGTTTEFLSIWALMMLGPQPFFISPTTEALEMRLLPALPRWFFKEYEDGKPPRVIFKLFGSVTVTYYHQRGTEDLYRTPPSCYQIILRDGSTFNVSGSVIPATLADKVRRVVFVSSIDVYFQSSTPG